MYNSLFQIPENIETRWASPENFNAQRANGGQLCRGRKGSAWFRLNAGESKVLAKANGNSGVIRRIWITINDRSPKFMRGLKIEMFWDNAETPAVSAPFGDFFCQGLGRTIKFENAFFSNPEGRSFNCYIPMPFKKSMKIVLTNETKEDLDNVYYDINFTLGDDLPENICYFHTFWNRQHKTVMLEDYELLPMLKGRGRFLGVNIGVIPNQKEYFRAWWGEGEVKIYIDEDSNFPTLCGTGTEDYIGTAWGQGQYSNLYQGCHLADEKNFQYCFYRLHIPDPIFFQNSIRATIQQIGGTDLENSEKMKAKKVSLTSAGTNKLEKINKYPCDFFLFEREDDDWSSVAYFYLNKP